MYPFVMPGAPRWPPFWPYSCCRALTDAAAITKAGYMLSYRLTDPYLIELYGGNIDGPITTAGGSEFENR